MDLEIIGAPFEWTTDINDKGSSIVIIENSTKIIIYQDIFSTCPLYYKIVNNALLISKDMEALIDRSAGTLAQDIIGFNQLLNYGNCIWTRTTVATIKQIPFSSKLQFDKATGKIDSIQNYFNELEFTTKDNRTYVQILDQLHSILVRIFNDKITENKKYSLGLSGGLDSRLTFAYASLRCQNANLKTYTFGFNKKSDEYKIAKKIATSKNFQKPYFFKLIDKNYLASQNYISKKSCGMISACHGHIIEVANSMDEIRSTTHINTYLTDALFGYATEKLAKSKSLDKLLPSLDRIPQKIRGEFRLDVENVYNHLPKTTMFNTINEEYYIFERTSKFHMRLASIQKNHFHDQILVFNDFELIKFCFELPPKYRFNKKIIEDLLDRHFASTNEKSIPKLSSVFFKPKKVSLKSIVEIYETICHLTFRAVNLINLILRVVFKGKVSFSNKWQTEELENVFLRSFKKEYSQIISSSKNCRLFQRSLHSNKVVKHPVRSYDVAKAYQILSYVKFFND